MTNIRVELFILAKVVYWEMNHSTLQRGMLHTFAKVVY